MRLLFLSLCLVTSSLFGETVLFEKTAEIKKECEVESGFTLEIENLMGTLTLEQVEGNTFECVATTRVVTQEEAKTADLAQKIALTLEADKKNVRCAVDYPKEVSFYYYPLALQDKGRKKGVKYKTRTEYHGKEAVCLFEPSIAAVTCYADVVCKVPKASKVTIKNYIGKVTGKGLNAEIVATGNALFIDLENTKGLCTLTTGNGGQHLSDCTGTFQCTTGTGKVDLVKCQGDLTLQTGTGPLLVDSSTLKMIKVKSGSGALTFKKSEGSLFITSGSGRVSADDFIAKKAVHIDTGSGDIRLKGEFSALEELTLRSGSGDIAFTSKTFPELTFDLNTASGEIDVKVEDMKAIVQTPNAFCGTTTETETRPNTKALLTTGAGDIKLMTAKIAKRAKKKST